MNISLDNSCSYYGEKIVDDVYSFNSTDEAEEIVGRIVKIVGLEQNFDIKSANVPNALATIKNGSRLILYSQNFILNIKNATGTDWSGISILAHEIGHHLNGHTIISGGSRPNLELQADKFSGFVAAKLGASLSDAQAAISKFSSKSGSSTHPPKSARLEAIAIGWNQGNSGSKPPSEPEPVRESSNEKENVISNTTTTARIIYTGDNYGCGLPIQITIGNKTFTPNNNSFEVSGIPLGTQKYSIQGQINCPAIGGCSASGQGTLNISENATFYISWQNVSFGQCNIWLQPG
ncbi:hypothetical protein NC796_22395 [Aliifodinibius sp. S!AR15-10]|nr:hypothetical protein [Aliifodinibius sp. S!AR15-10]